MRARLVLLSAIALAVCLLPAGCSKDEEEPADTGTASTAPDPSSPGALVKEFYDHLNAGHYDAALGLYAADARSTLTDPNLGGQEGFASWAKEETKGGSIQEVSILGDMAGSESASVDYEIVYKDTSKARRSVTLTREGGSWKMGMVGASS